MKNIVLAAVALMSLGAAPAMAGEPFPNNAGTVTTQTALTAPQVAATGSAAGIRLLHRSALRATCPGAPT